ncbi:MAG: hypothetical protein KY397_06840 [Gemmatimonadetes bacterium]|nr:hypothetical protein [Gemmatimonadota bacterium]
MSSRAFEIALRGAATTAAVAVAACGYSFRSPVPPHLNTVYVPTFENETREFQLTQQLTERMIDELQNESRLRLAGDEEDADLVVRGTITNYEEEALAYDPGQAANPNVFSRRVLLTVDITLEDRVNRETLWENPSLREWGEFSEENGETREDGIRRALEKIAEEVLRNVVEEF